MSANSQKTSSSPRSKPPASPALFALDQNFPEPILTALGDFMPEADLVPLRRIDPLLTAEIDDWEVLLALHHHERPWDGLITTDSGILNLPREMAVLRQTNLTLVVTDASGHDPIRATGLLFTHLPWIARQTTSAEPQVWQLRARNKPARDPLWHLDRIAQHRSQDVEAIWREARLTAKELATDPLAL